MNIFLFFDYYCARVDALDYIDEYQPMNGSSGGWSLRPDGERAESKKSIEKYFAIFSAVLGLLTVLTVVMYGFAVNLYYYEKEALRRKRLKWRRRMNRIFESQSQQPMVPPETDDISSDLTDVVSFKPSRRL